MKSPERQFLHDISTPVSAALFVVDVLLEAAKEKDPNSAEVAQLATVMESLRQAKTLIDQRRQMLIKEADNS